MSSELKGLVGILILTVGILFIVRQCEKSENSRDLTHIDQRGTWQRVCLEGHVILVRHKSYQGYSVNKLDDDGKPVKCER